MTRPPINGLRVFFCTALVAVTVHAGAASTDLCARLKADARLDEAKSRISLFLIGPTGELSDGPIAFGKFKYADRAEFVFYVPTSYRIIAMSKFVAPANSDQGGSLHLLERKPTCAQTKEFDVSLVSRKSAPELLPYKIDYPVESTSFKMPTRYDQDEEVEAYFHFKPRIIGEIVSAQ